MSSSGVSIPGLPVGYPRFLADIKNRIRAAQIRATLSANQELVRLYWDIGRRILNRQDQEGWGAKVINRLAQDLLREFPEMRGFSPRNLLFMRAFAEVYDDFEIVKQLVSQIPWGHIVRLIQSVDDRLRGEGDSPSIGLILCRDKDRISAEYALRDIQKPIGVSDWKTKITRSLPLEFKSSLPTIKQIEAELSRPEMPGRKIRRPAIKPGKIKRKN